MSGVCDRGPAGHRRSAFISALRAEIQKSRHAAPLRLAVIMAIPFPVLGGLIPALANPAGTLSFSSWNYWYSLLMAVMVSLSSACIAQTDARLKNRNLIAVGAPVGGVWWAKVTWGLVLLLLSNLVVCGLYFVASLVCPAGAPGLTDMLATVLVTTITSSWLVPATMLITASTGMLAGIFIPLSLQIACCFAWSFVPFWPAFPPAATMIIPTAFLPVLPSGEPLGADMVLAGTLGTFDGMSVAALAIAAAFFLVLTSVGAAWLSRAEERSR